MNEEIQEILSPDNLEEVPYLKDTDSLEYDDGDFAETQV